MNSKDNKIVIYQDENGVTKISVRFADEDLWLTQAQLAEIYDTTQQNISQHVDGIYSDGELDREATNKKFLLVREEGTRRVKRNIDHYNLDMIIALGYRVQSHVATRFRRWATERLHEYIQKGFTMDDDRLKQGGSRYFRELLQRIRDIRSSERNFYQQVTDIYSTAIDYDPRSDMTKKFFATVQNKLYNWTSTEKKQILSAKWGSGLKGYDGCHIVDVSINPSIASNPNNIIFLKRYSSSASEISHFATVHLGNWQNASTWNVVVKVMPQFAGKVAAIGGII